MTDHIDLAPGVSVAVFPPELHDGRAYPVLAGYVDGATALVWCLHCHRWHNHGAAGGHRVAPCDPQSPYSDTGYFIRLVGEFTAPMRRHAEKARRRRR